MEAGTGVVVGVMAAATVVVFVASITGNGQALCDRMGGTYTPNVPHGQNVCPGGSWGNFFSGVKRPAQFDEKK